MTPKTILMLLSNAYDPDPRVRQEALSLIGMGCRVRLLAWDRDLKAPAFEHIEGIDVERIFVASSHGRGAMQAFFYLRLYLKMFWRGMRARFDAVHCHDLDTLPLGFLLGTLRRRPIVYDAHESFPDMLAGSIPAFAQRGLTWLETYLIRRITLLITVGEKLRCHFADRGATRTVVIGNWKRLTDFSRTPEQIRDIRRRLGVPEGALAVACVTQLRDDRKIDELLAAADESPDVYVVIAGAGVLERRVAQAAAANPRVIFGGFVTGPVIGDYTCAADVIYYGFDPDNPNARFSAPNKLFEALAAGRPLITGDFGEIAEVVRRAQCGIVLPEYSVAEIKKAFNLLSDVDVRSGMARNAAETGQASLNWDKAEAILYREYSALLPGLREPGHDKHVQFARAPAVGQ